MNDYMKVALDEAKKSYDKGEIPIGAVIVQNNRIIAKAHNDREKSQIATHHAEIIAIEKACKKLKSWRLDDCEMYVSLIPCPMCAGAIVNSRIKKVYYGAKETNTNDCIMIEAILNNGIRLNHKTEIEFKENLQCSAILSKFFKEKRTNI